tara:strand:+ start:10172 stop:11008 length:837 start_codon:yes stop_codon:yes gene_type:complete
MDYYSHPAMSRSKLVDLDNMTPYKFWCKYIDKSIIQESTQAFDFGKAFHSKILEPELFDNEFSFMPKIDRRTKVGKEEYQDFIDNNSNKTVLDNKDFITLDSMEASINSDKFIDAKQMIQSSTSNEEEFYFELQGLEFRAKLDSINTKDHIIIDIKTCRDAFIDGLQFGKEMIKYHNAEQVYIYIEAYKYKYNAYPNFYFITFEKSSPFEIQIFDASVLYEYGKYKVTKLIDKYKNLLEIFGNNPWIDNSIQYAELPVWAEHQCEEVSLIMDDEEVII